jgi:NTE family protein
MKTALVLSAGGMYGAYQAGVWKVLSQTFEPDIVVGASIGAMNAWAIAGLCSPDHLIERWLQLDPLAKFRFRFPPRLIDGFVDSSPLQALVTQVYDDFRPRLDVGVVATDTMRLKPVLFRGAEVTWQHLAASTAILGFFSQHRINNRVYSDGGLLEALPIWAAVEMGARRIIAVNVLAEAFNPMVKKAGGAIRSMARFRPAIPDDVEVIRINAPGLGNAKDALYWKRDNVARWIELGEKDALVHLEAVG